MNRPAFRPLLATLLLIFVFASPAHAQSGSIRGNVSDAITHDGLAGAFVSIPNINVKKITDDKGNFYISQLSPGAYDVSIEYVGYGVTVKHVILGAGENYKLFVSLTPEAKAEHEVVVTGRLNNEKESGSRTAEKNASNITNYISYQAMTRSPDINAANVLQRMSGITLQKSSGGDEAYAVIRGMEPRYNNTLLNGIKIASPDNKNRFVQLDIIPSDILSSIEISKSLLPNMEGDAVGGTVNMIVKDAPEARSFRAITSIGYSQLFFDEKYVNFKKSAVQSLSPVQRNASGYVAQPGDFSRPNLDFQPRQAPVNGTLGFSSTQRFLHNKFGLVLADNLQSEYYGNISRRYTVAPININTDTLGYQTVSNFKQYSHQLNNGLVAHVDYVFNDRNAIGLDNFFIYSYLAQSRISEDTTLLGTGRVGPGTGQIFPAYQSFVQQQHIENLKLSGRHAMGTHLFLDWAGVLSAAGRRVPDLATINTDYLIQADHSKTGTYFDDITRQWLRNDDRDYTGILNLRYHGTWMGHDLELKAGGLYRTKTRFNNEDDYVLKPPNTNSSGGAASKPAWTGIYDAQWDVFNPSGTGVYNPNNYHASETVFAEYLMLQAQSNKIQFGGGLRVENTQTNWDILVHSPTAPSSGNQIYQDFLPSAYVKYLTSDKQFLHLSYFRSISRPNYYELVPAPVFAGDYYISGNPTLQHAVADNLDLRYELFPKGEQHFFVGVFYKQIQNPIEQLLQSVRSGVLVLQPVNSQSATNYGAEASFTQYFGKLGITGNYTYTRSAINSVKLRHGGASIVETRPMQGQTDHIANVSLLYKDVKKGFFAQLAYGYQGKTLSEISFYYQSDYYQKPMNTLAFSLEKDIKKHFTLFGKFNNLLNTPTVQYVQKTLEVSRDEYKASYSIGLRYSR